MVRLLKTVWSFLTAKRVALQHVDTVLSPNLCEVRLHEKQDGLRWITLVAKGGNSTIYVPMEPEQALALAETLTRLAEVARGRLN
jgi:hypothetical protein